MAPKAPVRPARPADAIRLRRLQQLLTEPSPALLTAALDSQSTESSSPAASAVSDDAWHLLVSPDANDQAVGYLLALSASEIHLAELVVAPAYRRQKRATALLAVVCESAARPVTVCVAAENHDARSLYDGFGFSVCSRSDDQFDSDAGLTLRYEPSTES